MLKQIARYAVGNIRRSMLVTYVILLVFVGLAPLLMVRAAGAAQLTSRSVSISTAQASATGVSYTFTFTPATSSVLNGMKFQACTTPLGSCTTPSGFDLWLASSPVLTGWQDTSGTWSTDTSGQSGSDCFPNSATNVLCFNRSVTATTPENTSTAHTVKFSSMTNPDGTSCSGTANCTFFIRLTTYSSSSYGSGSIIDTGTVATATTQALTVNAAVQEVLSFCVGSTSVDDVNTTSVASDCTGVSGTSVDLGVLDIATVNVTPSDPVAHHGDGMNGVAMVRTNAVHGITIDYDAIQQSGTNHKGTLRVAGSTCSAANTITDQCINAIGTAQSTITAGTEDFGMDVAGVNCKAVQAYSCDYTTGSSNLKPTSNYQGDGTFGSSYVYGTTNGFAWDESGTPQAIATSSTVVDDEALIIKFAATPSITTPTGAYTAQTDFIAIPVY